MIAGRNASKMSMFSGTGREGLQRRKGALPITGRGHPSSNTALAYPFLDDTKLLKKYRKDTRHVPPGVAKSWKKDKLVRLVEEDQQIAEDVAPEAVEEFEPEQPATTGRITMYCTASAYNLVGLQEHLEQLGYSCKSYPEVLHSRYVQRTGEVCGEIFLFEFGAAVLWDLSPQQERSILQDTLKRFEERPLASYRVEEDTFSFRYLPYSKPYIQNDMITMSPNLKDAALLKLSISFALGQSVKLSVLEERVLRLATLTRPLPTTLAKEGKVKISDTDIAKLMGRVFLEQSQLNLLGSVLDTPDFFWEAGVPDSMQNIYDRMWEYLEMEDRVEVLNARLGVLHEMLDMLRMQQNAVHGDHMELIIIWLIVVDVFILLFQLAAIMGWIGKGLHH